MKFLTGLLSIIRKLFSPPQKQPMEGFEEAVSAPGKFACGLYTDRRGFEAFMAFLNARWDETMM